MPLPFDKQTPLSSVGDIVLIGSMYEVYDSPPGTRYLIRLPGCDLNQSTLRVGVVDISGYSEGANLSAVGLHFSKPCAPSSLPDWATIGLHRLLDFLPPCGRARSAAGTCSASCQGSVSAGSRCLASLSTLVPPLLELRDSLIWVTMPVVSVSELLRPRSSDLLPRARRSLLPSHREFILMNQWGVPHLPVPAMLIFGHLERKVRAWLRSRYPLPSAISSSFRFHDRVAMFRAGLDSSGSRYPAPLRSLPHPPASAFLLSRCFFRVHFTRGGARREFSAR